MEYFGLIYFIKIISRVITKDCNIQINGVTCSASSEFDNKIHSYPCENAINGDSKSSWTTQGEGVGAWIKLYFGEMYRVAAIRIKHRGGGLYPSRELFKGISLEFSDGQTSTFTLNNIPYTAPGGLVWNNIPFPKHPSSDYVKITATSVYGTINNGFSDIRVYGCRDGIITYIYIYISKEI